MYRWFGVIPQVGEVFFPSFFVAIFGALCWRSFEDDFLGFLWVSRMRILCLFSGDFIPKSILNRTRFGGFSSWASSLPREAISSIPLDCERFGSIPLR
jgi:hypothetical protein